MYVAAKPALGAAVLLFLLSLVGTPALVVAVICVSGYEVWDALEDGGAAAAHVVFAAAVLVVLLVKIVIVHRGGRAGRLLPYLGVTVAGLFVAVWATSTLPLLG